MASRAVTATVAASGTGSEELKNLQMAKSYVEEERRRYGGEDMGKEMNLREK